MTSTSEKLVAEFEAIALPSLRLFWNGSIVVVLDDNERDEAYGTRLTQQQVVNSETSKSEFLVF